MGGGRLLVGVCAALMAVAVVNVAAREAATATSVVVGFAKCAHCSRKKMKPEAAFKRTCLHATTHTFSLFAGEVVEVNE